MSLMDTFEQKQLLPRHGADEFWSEIQELYAKEDPLAWQRLAMFALRESVGWTIDQIGFATGRHPGHVTRAILSVKQELRRKFRDGRRFIELEDGFSDPDEP